jgi:hypothetical protein
MAYYIVKLVLSAVLIVVISEVARRSSLLAGILASLPLVSVLAMIWLYVDTRDVERVAVLASSVFWLVLPSLVLFLLLPVLLRAGLAFFPSLLASAAATALAYYLMIRVLARLGIPL